MNLVSHLEGAIDGARLDPSRQQTTHEGRPILVRYDLEQAAGALKPAILQNRQQDMWRLSELLPLQSERVSLGENMTPLLACPNLGRANGLNNVWVKDESTLPTGSFKSRGQAVAISMAKHFGTRRVAIPTAGNAGGAMAAYAARAGLEAFVFMPEDTPRVNQVETVLYGANVFLVNGLIDDCGRIVREGRSEMGWFDISTLKEPYRLEGKKTMGFEIAVQSEGCAPVVKAFDSGNRFCDHFEGADTVARDLRVPSAVGDFLILDAIREGRGCAIAVREDRILDWVRTATGMEGISFCPESAACVGALEQLAEERWIHPDEHVVIFNCASANKYVDIIDPQLPKLDGSTAIDWDAMKQNSGIRS